MFENEFTIFLLGTGWKQIDLMSFANDIENITIHFDTSNQIEINQGEIRIGSYYLKGIEDLKNVLDNLK